MRNTSTMAVLAMRAIASMPAGASPEAIQKHIVEAIHVRNNSVRVILETLLRKGYAEERSVKRPGMRHAPLVYYSLTPSGWKVLEERSLLPVAQPTPKSPPRMAQQADPRPTTLAGLPRWRKPTPGEVRRAGVKSWQLSR